MTSASTTIAAVMMAPSRAALDHERTAADALGAPVGERPADLLLERQEQPGPGHEDEAPERAEGGVLRVAQAPLGDDDEDVRGDRGDHEARADCEGPLGDGVPRSSR